MASNIGSEWGMGSQPLGSPKIPLRDIAIASADEDELSESNPRARVISASSPRGQTRCIGQDALLASNPARSWLEAVTDRDFLALD
eukprot:CAMPEP_0113537920 /NCGR_PEP_ID=MMETSP0015_2-20120614/7090_1 /TAXON_ID=2838 /ORGANISM="Odontella" /LENGTH=85 /DNA_ID=CAMNT_0000437461 /DNA_START=512 /DNA_END=767 /DNA_ORIENTATION=- /assembly_acc=CAM_ASM_000160